MKKQLKLLRELIENSENKIELFDHNGVSIEEYPTEFGWNLIPFPKEKGIPFNADNLATISRAPFLNDEKFQKSRLEAESRWNGNIKKRDISWRLDIVLWAISQSLRAWNRESIFVECGTGAGYMASAITSYFNWDESKPDFYLVDTFLPFMPDNDGNQNNTNPTLFAYSVGDENVRKYFSKFESIKILTGFIPDILKNLPDKKISFLHIDLNSAIAENAALEFLKSKLIPGAIILFDDYGGFGGEDQALIHESFVKSMGARILSLPTGQALYFHL